MKSSEKEEQFERGLRHFNAREFFEAHEVWEEVWLVENEPEKTFLQGIIQIAAAFHHYRRGNTDGAESLLASGIVKLTRFPGDHRGLAIHDLREEAKWWARALGEMRRPGDERLPAIRPWDSADTAAESRAKVHADKK
jgi:predicted metal-dependent hydrolase